MSFSRISSFVGSAFSLSIISLFLAGTSFASQKQTSEVKLRANSEKQHIMEMRGSRGLHGDLSAPDPLAHRGHDGPCRINETIAKTFCEICIQSDGAESCKVVCTHC